MTDAPNAAQAEYWNAVAGSTWAALQDPLDAQLEPIGLEAMAVLAPAEGEHILDIGCGAGATALELAWRIDPEGSVTGVDISAPLLEVARRRARDAGYEQVKFVQADAQTHAFEKARFDAAFSRFGVMFFADPAAAFANIRGAVRPGGRLAFACWRPFAENPWMSAPMEAALRKLPPQPTAPPQDPNAPGPFAFADQARVRGILEAAGWRNVRHRPLDLKIGGRSLQESIDTALRVGPLGALLRDQPDKAPVVIEILREEFQRHLTPDGVRMASAVWIVTADNPA